MSDQCHVSLTLKELNYRGMLSRMQSLHAVLRHFGRFFIFYESQLLACYTQIKSMISTYIKTCTFFSKTLLHFLK